TLVADHAMADAARADEQAARGGARGVLHGLPVAHKDLVDTAGIRTKPRARRSALPLAHKDLVDTAGIRTTRGSRFYSENVPTRDALIVTRLHAAGAVTCGQTNTPEFGSRSQKFYE